MQLNLMQETPLLRRSYVKYTYSLDRIFPRQPGLIWHGYTTCSPHVIILSFLLISKSFLGSLQQSKPVCWK